MSRIMMKGNADVEEVALLLKDTFQNKTKTCELIDGFNRTYGQLTMHVMVFERYYLRAANRATLTIVITGNQHTTIVDAIATIAGKGSLINFSWGTEEDFICNVQTILLEKGFYHASEEK